jgi:hypothetical protein
MRRRCCDQRWTRVLPSRGSGSESRLSETALDVRTGASTGTRDDVLGNEDLSSRRHLVSLRERAFIAVRLGAPTECDVDVGKRDTRTALGQEHRRMPRRAEARPDLGDGLLDDLDRRSEHRSSPSGVAGRRRAFSIAIPA